MADTTNKLNHDDDFTLVEVDNRITEKIDTPKYSYWGSVAKQFFSNKVTIAMPVSYTHLTLPTNREV